MQPRNPSWNDLRIFLEVARAGSFSGGARNLRLDVSTVSRRITYLEQCMNMALFERNPIGLKNTPNGNALVEHAQSMEVHALAAATFTGVQSQTSLPAGAVRIGTMEGIASFYLAEKFVEFRDRFPQLSLELVTSAHHLLVNHREADLFLSFFPPEGRGLGVKPIGQFHLHLYGSPAYLEKRGMPTGAEDLNDHDFVSYIEDLVQLNAVRWLNEAVPAPRTVFHSSSMIAQMHYAAAGGGLVLLPEFMLAERTGMVRVLPDKVWVSRTVWLTVHNDLQYMPRIKATVAFLIECFARDYPCPPGVIGG